MEDEAGYICLGIRFLALSKVSSDENGGLLFLVAGTFGLAQGASTLASGVPSLMLSSSSTSHATSTTSLSISMLGSKPWRYWREYHLFD